MYCNTPPAVDVSMWKMNKELVSFTVDVRGIKFYSVFKDLKASGGFLNVDFVHEKHNLHNDHSILVVLKTKSPE